MHTQIKSKRPSTIFGVNLLSDSCGSHGTADCGTNGSRYINLSHPRVSISFAKERPGEQEMTLCPGLNATPMMSTRRPALPVRALRSVKISRASLAGRSPILSAACASIGSVLLTNR